MTALMSLPLISTVAEVFYAYARRDVERWQWLTGCRVQVLGRGVGEITGVDNS
jgi:hypothetical protein